MDRRRDAANEATPFAPILASSRSRVGGQDLGAGLEGETYVPVAPDYENPWSAGYPVTCQGTYYALPRRVRLHLATVYVRATQRGAGARAVGARRDGGGDLAGIAFSLRITVPHAAESRDARGSRS